MNKEIIFQILSTITGTGKDVLMNLPQDQSLSDLGWDSIKFIQFIVAVEEECQIEIHDSDLLFINFETMEKLFSTLEKYME